MGDRPASVPRFLSIPNQLTLARLALSVVFFVLLGLEEHGVFGATSRSFILNIANLVFVLAVTTDFLDGYLARRWRLVSNFGRIADPFVDKIVICGGFIMLIGVAPDLVKPWFAVVILFREFLVSGLRSFLEARGVPFGATLSGKLKMLLQSIAIPAVLIHEANFSPSSTTALSEPGALTSVTYWTVVALLAITLLSTLVSCLLYVARAIVLLRSRPID